MLIFFVSQIMDLLRKLMSLQKLFSPQARKFTITILVFLSIGIARFLGFLESAELQTLDWLFQIRNSEPKEERIVIVEISESDLNQFTQYPITDYELYLLLSKIQEQNPRVVGIDLYRDLTVKPEYQQGEIKLNNFLESPFNNNIIGIEKTIDSPDNPKVLPHPIFKKYGQIASVDTILDRDSRVRRAIIAPDPISRPELASLNYILAAFYLEKEGIGQQDLLDNASIINRNTGGYAHIDSGGDQIFLNYISPPDNFTNVKAFDVIKGKIPKNLLQDKIVIICTKTQSFPDIFYTPFMEKNRISPIEIYGGYIQANATSQLISSALDNRPLIKVLPVATEYIVIALFIAGTNLWGSWCEKRSRIHLNFLLGAASLLIPAIILSGLIIYGAYQAFVIGGWWLPIFPVITGIGITTIVSTIVIPIARTIEYQNQLKNTNKELEQVNSKLEQKQLELEEYNHILENKVEQRSKQLERARKRIEADLRLTQLGASVVGVTHQIGNPIAILRGNIKPTLESLDDLLAEIDNLEPILAEEDLETLNAEAHSIKKGLEVIKEQEQRIRTIMVTMMDGINPNQVHLPKFTDINELLSFTAKSIFSAKKLEGYPSFSFEIYCDPNLKKIEIVPVEIAQVFGNLIDNACHAIFTKKESSGKDYKPTIQISTKASESYIAISIRDNGMGIPEDLKENDSLFAAFSTGKTSGFGTGLGLAIAKTLVEKNSGQINYHSSPGQYTEFIIELPFR